MRFIPVDFPFFEEVRVNVKKFQQSGSSNSLINKYGEDLAKKKWGKLAETDWNKTLQEIRNERESKENCSCGKYEMIFIQGLYPSFQLEFTS